MRRRSQMVVGLMGTLAAIVLIELAGCKHETPEQQAVLSLFLGADGLDPERGVMTPHLSEAQLNAKMIAISRQVIAVADASKFQRRNISLIARTDQLHMVITNSEADPAIVAALEARGIEVLLA